MGVFVMVRISSLLAIAVALVAAPPAAHAQPEDDLAMSTACPVMPPIGCKAAVIRKAKIKIKDVTDKPHKDSLSWSFKKGAATETSEFGDPVGGSPSIAGCLYDSSARPQPLRELVIAPGGTCNGKPCWTSKNDKFQFKSKVPNADGVVFAKLISGEGEETQSKILLKAKGENLMPPLLPLGLPATMMFIVNDGTESCWIVPYDTFGIDENSEDMFKAKGPQ